MKWALALTELTLRAIQDRKLHIKTSFFLSTLIHITLSQMNWSQEQKIHKELAHIQIDRFSNDISNMHT